MDSTKAEAENIEPSAGKELLDKYWSDIKQEIDDINIVNVHSSIVSIHWDCCFVSLFPRWIFVRVICR